MNPTRTYDYLIKSRAHVFDWVRPLTPEQYTSEHPIALGSLARTLHHIMAAEWCYMQRIIGNLKPLGPLPPAHDPEPDSPFPFPTLESTWTAQATETRAALETAATNQTTWNTPLAIAATHEDGRPLHYHATPADIFTQLAFHEVHHRAQALHILRRLEVKTGEIDFNTLMYAYED